MEGGTRDLHAVYLGREGNDLLHLLGWNIVITISLQVLALDLASTHKIMGSDLLVVLIVVVLDAFHVSLEGSVGYATKSLKKVD